MFGHPALRELFAEASMITKVVEALEADAADLELRLALMGPMAARDGDDADGVYTGIEIPDRPDAVRDTSVDELFDILANGDEQASEEALDALVAYGAVDPDVAVRLAEAVDPDVLRYRFEELGARRASLEGDELAAFDASTWDPYAAYLRTLSHVDRDGPNGDLAADTLTHVFRLDEPPDMRTYRPDHSTRLLLDALGLGDWGGWFEQQVLRYCDEHHDAPQSLSGTGDPIAELELVALDGLLDDRDDGLGFLTTLATADDAPTTPGAVAYRAGR